MQKFTEEPRSGGYDATLNDDISGTIAEIQRGNPDMIDEVE